jgi:hypothetical protein
VTDLCVSTTPGAGNYPVGSLTYSRTRDQVGAFEFDHQAWPTSLI